jgi:general secretion pathway protein M
MKDWFVNLDTRERLLVVTAGVFIVFALYWFALWLPLDKGERNLQARVVNWQSSLTELRPLRSRLQASGAGPAANATQSLVVIVDSTLRSKNLDSALRRSQPTTTDGIRLEFENVVFDDLVLWLGELGSQFGLQVKSASFSNSASGTLGRVNASLTLER